MPLILRIAIVLIAALELYWFWDGSPLALETLMPPIEARGFNLLFAILVGIVAPLCALVPPGLRSPGNACGLCRDLLLRRAGRLYGTVARFCRRRHDLRLPEKSQISLQLHDMLAMPPFSAVRMVQVFLRFLTGRRFSERERALRGPGAARADHIGIDRAALALLAGAGHFDKEGVDAVLRAKAGLLAGAARGRWRGRRLRDRSCGGVWPEAILSCAEAAKFREKRITSAAITLIVIIEVPFADGCKGFVERPPVLVQRTSGKSLPSHSCGKTLSGVL